VLARTLVAASAQGRLWHTFPIRCDAAIPSGYRVTFVVGVWPATCVLMTTTADHKPGNHILC